MKKIIHYSLMIFVVFLIGCASTQEEEVDLRPLPPENDVSYNEPGPMPEPHPEPLPDSDPYSEPVHVPTNEELNISPDADSYEQVRYNEEVEQVARRARQSYTPEIDHTPGEPVYVEVRAIHFNDRDELVGVRQALLGGTHFNYKIKELPAPNRKSAHFKLWSNTLSSLNLQETLNNLFANEGYDVNIEKRSEHLLIVTSNY